MNDVMEVKRSKFKDSMYKIKEVIENLEKRVVSLQEKLNYVSSILEPIEGREKLENRETSPILVELFELYKNLDNIELMVKNIECVLVI